MAKKSFKESVWAIVICPKGKILILKRSKTSNNPNLLNFPGGSLEAGEFALECAYRELWEEAGIEANTVSLMGSNVVTSGRKKIHAFVFALNSVVKVKRNKESSKHFWMKPKKVATSVKKASDWHEQTRKIVTKTPLVKR
jgi:mutator protein MutT